MILLNDIPIDRQLVLDQVGSGWANILDSLIDDLFQMGWDGHLSQVKEKFGGLRFYIDGGTEAIFHRINRAEAESYRTCEVCGSPGEERNLPWIRTLCNHHYKERNGRS